MNNIKKINQSNIQKLITGKFENLAPTYYRLISEWMNSSYEVFNDIEKYRIILYLINKDFEYYIKNGKVESYDNFFMFDKSLELDRINIIEISKNLNIPKESTRRKILDLEKLTILQKAYLDLLKHLIDFSMIYLVTTTHIDKKHSSSQNHLS